jgi:hypothetical protein
MFTTVGGDGVVTFSNEEHGFNFPYQVNHEESGQIEDLRFMRVAFPKYVERKPTFNNAVLFSGDDRYPLELVEDVNAVSFRTLEQRMLLEMSRSLLRAAVKKSLEVAVSQENEGLGAIVSLINAVTEKADTRNWQTLPHSIYYARVPLKPGTNSIRLKVLKTDSRMNNSQTFKFTGHPGKTIFHAYQTLN